MDLVGLDEIQQEIDSTPDYSGSSYKPAPVQPVQQPLSTPAPSYKPQSTVSGKKANTATGFVPPPPPYIPTLSPGAVAPPGELPQLTELQVPPPPIMPTQAPINPPGQNVAVPGLEDPGLKDIFDAPEYVEQMSNNLANPESKPKSTDFYGDMYAQAKAGLKWHAQAFDSGIRSVKNGLVWSDYINGRITREEAEKQTQPTAEQLSFDQEFSKLSPWDLHNIGAFALQSAPFMGATITAGIEGAAVSTPIGAATGGLPGASAAASWGFGFGGFLGSKKIMEGLAFKTYIDAGIPEKEAKEGAAISGSIAALIETMQLRMLGAGAQAAYDKMVSSVVVNSSVRKVFFDVFSTMGIQGAEEAAQQATQDFMQIHLANMTKHPEAIPRFEDMMAGWAQNFAAGATVGLAFKGLSHLSGAAAGKVASKFFDEVDLMSKEKLAELQAQDSELQRVQQVEGKILKPGQAEGKTDLTVQQTQELIAKPLTIEEATARVNDLREQQQVLNKQQEFVTTSEEETALKESQTQLNKQMREAKVQKREAELRQTLDEIQAKKESYKDPAKRDQQQKAIDTIQADIKDVKLEAVQKEVDASIQETESAYNKSVIDLKERQNETVRKISDIDKQVASLESDIQELSGIESADQSYTDSIIEKTKQADDLLERRNKLEARLKDLNEARVVARHESRLNDLRDIKAMLDEGGDLTNEVLSNMRTEIASGKVEKIGRTAVTEMLKAVSDTKRNTQENIQQNQKLYNKLVKLALPNKADRAELPAANALTTPAQLTNAVNKVLETTGKVYEKQARNESMAELRKQLKRGEPKGTGNQKRSVLDRTTNQQKVINQISRLVNMGSKERKLELARIEDAYIEATKNGSVTPELQNEFDIANLVGDLSTKESNEVADLANTVKNIVDTGRTDQALSSQLQAESDQKIIDELSSAIEPHSDMIPGAKAPKFQGNFGDQLQVAGRSILSWSGKWRVVFRGMTKAAEFANKLDIHPIVENIRTLKRTKLRSIVDNISESTGMKFNQVVDYMVETGNDRVDFNYDGGRFEGTRAELMQYVMWSKVESLRKGLQEGNGFTFSTKDSWDAVADNTLTYRDKKVIEGLEKHYQQQGKPLAEAYKSLTGLDLAIEDYYGGRARRTRISDKKASAELSDYDTFSNELHDSAKRRFSAPTPGSTKARVDSGLALQATDVFNNAIQAAVTNSHYEGWAPHSKFFSRLMSDSMIMAAVKRNSGDAMWKSLETHLNATIRVEPELDTMFTKLNNWVMSNSWTVLALKPMSYIKQASSVINVARYVPLTDFVEGIHSYYSKDMAHADRVIESTNYWTNRYDQFESTIAGVVGGKSDVKNLRKNQMKEKFLLPMILGDKEVTRAGWWTVYKSALKHGSTTEDAILAANKAIDATQSTSNMAELSDVARSGIQKALVMFGQQPTRLFEDEVVAAHDFFAAPSAKNLGKLAGVMMLNRVSQVAFLSIGAAWGMAFAHSDDERDQIYKDLYMAAATGTLPPVISDVVSALPDVLQGQRPSHDLKAMPLEAMAQTAYFAADFIKYANEGTILEHSGTLLREFARGPNLIFPWLGMPGFEPASRELKNKEKDRGSILDVIGG